MDERINLVVSSDDNYAQHAAIALMSAYERAHNKERIQSFILDGGISETKKEKIKESLKQYGGEITFIKMEEDIYKSMYTSHQYSTAIYYRLALPDLLDKSIKKCIYIDCDLLFFDDIEKLWDEDLAGHPVAAVEDIGLTTSKKGFSEKQRELGLGDQSVYFNSGVVIMDLEEWRKKGYSTTALSLASSHSFKSHDQDVLNKIFLDNWQQLDLRWNVIPPITYLYPKIVFSSKNRQRALKAKRNIGVLHYAGRYKPWEFKEYPEFNGYYYFLLRKSAFRNEVMPQLSKQNVGRNFSKELVRLKLADVLTNIL